MAYLDISTQAAAALLDAIIAAAEWAGVDDDGLPALRVLATGDSIPTADACNGMVWARVGNVYPTDGSGNPMTATRFDSNPVAWATNIELGFLWCHTNITEDGGWIEAADEQAYAERDGLWRMILLTAVGYQWRDAVAGTPLGDAIMAQQVSPFQPIGPDGGFSGGIVVATLVAPGLAICT